MTIAPISIATLVIGSVAILSMLHALSTTLLRLMAMHDLRVETERLRAEYAKRLAEHRRGREESVEVLDVGEAQDQAKAA